MPLTVDEALLSSRKIDVEAVLSRLAYVYQNIYNSGDLLHATKIAEVIEKVQNQNYSIAFCGHFSAGKSSLINHLFANGILPTRPIPTSANIVKVTNGAEKATITFIDGRKVQFDPPFQMEQIKQYCIDGEHVRYVEIQHPTENIPAHVSIVDTPGIDSTDDSHRQATESMLHLVDTIFYVMDYNHVQSELNFDFTKAITNRNIKLFLVINQIDKHRDEELPMSVYQASVAEAFKQWNVQAEAIFYTSLHNSASEHNELDHVVNTILTLFKNKDTQLLENALYAADVIIRNHLHWLKEEEERKHEEEIQQFALLADKDREALLQQKEQLERKIAEGEQATTIFEEQFLQDFQKILHNIALMPYETRQLAMEFLESAQPNFKVGFIFTEKKTEAERARRLDVLFADIKSKVAAQLDWHVQALLKQYVESYRITDGKLLRDIVEWSITIDKDVLLHAMKKDAQLNGDYLLNYAKEVTEAIKLQYRKNVLSFLERMKEGLSKDVEKERILLANQLTNVNESLHALRTVERIEYELMKRQSLFEQTIRGEVSQQVLEQARLTFKLPQSETVVVEKVAPTDEMPLINSNIQNEASPMNTGTLVDTAIPTTDIGLALSDRLVVAATKLRNAAALVSELEGFRHDTNEMIQKASRLEQNQFTVALFGAFSAGKSSFANALMGMDLVPTSPNPTTATITKILYPTSEYLHGTIRIKVKSEVELLSDLQHSLQVFERTAASIAEALEQADNIQADALHPKEKTHYAFFQAVKKGYAYFCQLFDHIVELNIEQLEDYIAREENAVFIEWVEMYYDNPLTAQGITLVDTPGADSIHARHTGVAFEYIKNADVILYVTYYNHAFSRADEQFLTQLGRVKDAFELDKMFFIVNAIDLATTKEEILLVQQYVEQNLLSFGIRNARIYPVSSKLALEAKTQRADDTEHGFNNTKLQETGFAQFEHDFIAYTLTELVAIALNGAHNDVARVMKKVRGYIELATQNEEQRNHRLQEVNDRFQKIKESIETFDAYRYERSLQQEIKELLYYISQRITYRMRDFFKISFSPAVLRREIKDIKQALFDALQEWIEQLNTEIMQEMQATSLRIEKHMLKELQSYERDVAKMVVSLDRHAVFGQYTFTPFTTLQWKDNVQHFLAQSHAHVLTLFKNHKYFFEQNGSHVMGDELIASIQAPLAHVIVEYEKRFDTYYTSLINEKMSQFCSYMLEQIDEYYAGEIAALSMTSDLNCLKQIQHQLAALID